MKNQKLYIILYATFLILSNVLFAQIEEVVDASIQFELDEIVVGSTKETNDMRSLPGSISFVNPRMMEERQIRSIVDISAVIPNFFIPIYGSKMSTPVYIRGIGERSTGQSIGMYVDNMPYLDKSVFNFEFLDVQHIEIMRGPQGTLYGRNAMSGIVNVYTYSPLDYERTRITLTAGNYGVFRTNASVSRKINNKTGLSISGYYDRNDGFFENQYNGRRADHLNSVGGRLRLDMQLAKNLKMQLMTNYHYSEQGAFPYGEYNNGKIAAPNYDHPGRYTRTVTGSNLNLEYKNDRIIFTSSSGFQYFDDDMHMDTDYTTRSLFTLQQRQKETNWTQEFAIKANNQNNYRWSFGIFAFDSDLSTGVVSTIKEEGIRDILQPNFPPFIRIADTEILTRTNNRGLRTPAHGIAVFHQSTYNNLLIKGLSLTAGIRLDYEKIKLDYDISSEMNLEVTPPNPPNASMQEILALTKLINSSASQDSLIWLPKFALKYEFDSKRYIYISGAKGHKSGGYNIQMFADIVRDVSMTNRTGSLSDEQLKDIHKSIHKETTYLPERSWNFELGLKGYLFNDILYAEAAVFYIDVDNVLITKFVESGQGRILYNAGRAESRGFDLSMTAFLAEGFTFSANYGLSKALVKDYITDETDETGNEIVVHNPGYFIPFAPKNTFSFAAGYNRRVQNSRLIDRFNVNAQYNGAGKIYWTEANDVHQKFYGLLNLRTGVNKGIFWLNLWTRNTLSADYTAFYIYSSVSERSFAQKGAPRQFGVDLIVSF